MTTMVGKIMAEVLSILALSTKEMQERRIREVYPTEVLDIFSDFETEKFVKRLGGRTDVEDALQRLDKLTQEEMRTTVAKNQEVTYSIKESAQPSQVFIMSYVFLLC
jgi:signal recognition particle GTPase